MKLFFDSSTGKIYYPVWDKNYFEFHHSTNIPLTEFEVEEINPDNKGICIDIINKHGKVDDVGDPKYYMYSNNGEWELHSKDGWSEYIEPPI